MRMSWFLTSFSPLLWLLLHCCIIVPMIAAGKAALFCSRDIYDNPGLQDCSRALAALPQADRFYRYYVEPQLGATPPQYDWEESMDERPVTFRQKIVQVPKVWSSGKQACSYEQIRDKLKLIL